MSHTGILNFKGVDGFRVDAIAYAYEQEEFRNEIKIDDSKVLSNSNRYPDFTFDYGPVHDLIMSFRKTLDLFSTEPGVERLMVAEVYST